MVSNNLRTPLLILASPRTGSTALGQYFKQQQFPTATYFIEPDWTHSVMQKFRNNLQSGNYDFIVKILYYCIDLYSDDLKNFLLSPITSKIRLRRRDTASQMASLYVAMYRNWTYHYLDKSVSKSKIPGKEYVVLPENTDVYLKEIIPIKDDQNMDWIVNEILMANKKIDESTLNFDLDLYYEDLTYLDETKIKKTPFPSNYADIKQAFENKLKRI